MPFSLDTSWVWDFWIADDGERFHLFYLHAPKSLGDERLRHRNARIGHAVSDDLMTWDDLGPVFGVGAPGEFDDTATWTGSVVRGPDGTWQMYYTGSRFLGADTTANIESVGLASSPDLMTWTKQHGPVTSADPEWYETLADATWREEAWRDPWVFRDAGTWHMLVTARARDGEGDDRGVIGYASSPDLRSWRVGPPLSAPGAGFAHIEVPQLVTIDGTRVLLFSCDTAALAGHRAGQRGGIWWLTVEDPRGPFEIQAARLLVEEGLYAARIVADRDGHAVLMAFENGTGDEFGGRICDPIPVGWGATGQLELRAVAPV